MRIFWCAAVAVAGLLMAGSASAQQMFRCGNNYQDRPCADVDLQSRYSVGRFDVAQVNPDTDKDCAAMAGEVMPYWTRMRNGETVEKLRDEYDAKPVGRSEKSAMRDLLIMLRGVTGSPTEVRGEMERRCMDNKRRRGLITERDIENARARARAAADPPVSPFAADDARLKARMQAEQMQYEIQGRREQQEAARAAAAAAAAARR